MQTFGPIFATRPGKVLNGVKEEKEMIWYTGPNPHCTGQYEKSRRSPFLKVGLTVLPHHAFLTTKDAKILGPSVSEMHTSYCFSASEHYFLYLEAGVSFPAFFLFIYFFLNS